MTRAQIRSAQFPKDLPAVSDLCWAYRDVLVDRMPNRPDIVEAYYAQDDYTALINNLPRIHARPQGDIRVAEVNNKIMGCAMYYPLAPKICEIKRVFVSAEARGIGLGKDLMIDGMQAARRDGYAVMKLDTMVNLSEAIALYEQLGFRAGKPYYDLDPKFASAIRFFEIDL